jgi:carboxyl-terminal processing protease
MLFRRSFVITTVIILCLGIGFVGGLLVQIRLAQGEKTYPILAQARSILAEHGLKPAPQDPALEYGMIRGMLQAYDDPYTIFVEPVQHELETNTLEGRFGRFGGIGVQLDRDGLGNVILFPIPDSPAAIAGVQEGDRLLQVDDQAVVTQSTTEDIQAALRGPVGSRVSITVDRPPDQARREYSIKRAEFSLPSVTWHLDLDEPRLGVVQINVIAASSPEETVRAFEDLKQRGATAFALDLRDNFGGLLDAGVDIARLFLTEGTVIEQQYRGQDVKAFKVDQAGKLADRPIAVLVNQHTASAAEIIAGALQEQKRAVIIGSTTYGKDSIQLVFDLDDGSSLHVTSAKWWVPGLQPPIGEGGLQPDILIPVDGAAGGDEALKAAAIALLGGS